MLKEMKLDNLGLLDDGKIQGAFDAAIRRLAFDCVDRPTDGKARSLTMQIKLVPVLDEQSREAERVRAQVVFKEAVPPRQTRLYDLQLRPGPNRTAMLAFSEASPENADQTTIFDEE